MTVGLAIGKFWPPHAGHHFLINELARRCTRVFVVVCEAVGQVPSGRSRATWLQAVHPPHEVVVVEDFCSWHHPRECEIACSARWAERISDLGVGKIDLVASSESYGSRFAELLGAQHLSVDPERARVPVSSTRIRADLVGTWRHLHRAVRVGLTRRLVVLGAESSGTTTLVGDLAAHLGLPSTGEAGRTVSWELFARADNEMTDAEWTREVFWGIVNQQIFLEHRALDVAADVLPGELGPWIVGDTDTLATVAWWERYLGSDSGPLRAFASVRHADLYLLTDPDGVEFDDSDPLRDGRAVRLAMHSRFRDLVEESGRPWRLVTGDRAQRVQSALEAMKEHETQFPRWKHH